MTFSFESETEYVGQTFKRLIERNVRLTRCEFDACTFSHCSFQESTFELCTFRDCTFTDCNLPLLHVKGSSFQDVRFNRSTVTGVNWVEGSWSAGGLFNALHFTECDLSYSTFIGLTLKKMMLTKCVAKDVDFSHTNLTQANCSYTDFFESRFAHTDLTSADFTHAFNYAIDANLNTLKNAKFSLPEAIALLRSMNITLVD